MADAHKHPESSSAFEDRIETVQNQAKRFVNKVEEAFKFEKEAMEKTFISEKEAMKETFESEKEAMKETFRSEKEAMEETFRSEKEAMEETFKSKEEALEQAFESRREVLQQAFQAEFRIMNQMMMRVHQFKDEAYAAIIREYLYEIDSGMTEEAIQNKIEQAKTRSLDYFRANVFPLSPAPHFSSFE